eukprot:5980849-Prymnesium_polylepis.1
MDSCKPKCRCEPTDVRWICAVPALAPESPEPACDILATTAIAFHRRALGALLAYGRAQRLGLMNDKETKALAIDCGHARAHLHTS